MEATKVGIREFRADLAEYIAASTAKLMLWLHGGCYQRLKHLWRRPSRSGTPMHFDSLRRGA